MIKGRFLFLYHTDHRSSWDTARCPCARIFPFITAILTPLCALQPLFPVHKGRCKPRLVLGRPKLIIGDSAGSQLIAESCRNLWEELFQHTCQQGGCSHFSIPKTVVGYWAFFHLQKHEGLMCCQVEQSCSVHKGVWMSPSDGFRWLISDEHGWVQAHSCAYGHHWKAEAVLAMGSVQDSAIWQSLCVYLSLRAFPVFFWCLLYERKLEKAAGILCCVLWCFTLNRLHCPMVSHATFLGDHEKTCSRTSFLWYADASALIYMVAWLCCVLCRWGSLCILNSQCNYSDLKAM